MTTRMGALAAVLLAVAATVADAAPASCPPLPKAIARPAVLGPVFPTPRGYVYTSGKRKTGAAIVSGYLKTSMTAAYEAWWSTITGSGRYHGMPHVGRAHTVVGFKAWSGPEHGQVDIYKTCDKRVTAVITYYAR